MRPPNVRPRAAAAALALALSAGLPFGTGAVAQLPAQEPAAAADTASTTTATAPAAGPVIPAPVGLASPTLATASADTGRPRAVTYSDAYGTRLTIHRYASYATLPVFAAEYVLGSRLLHARDLGQSTPQGTKTAHTAVAVGLGALFAVNTVTGAWNWWDARHDPNGRARRTVHSVLMLAADAGFAAAGALAGNASSSRSGAHIHRNVALVSMGVATAGGLMMYLWKD